MDTHCKKHVISCDPTQSRALIDARIPVRHSAAIVVLQVVFFGYKRSPACLGGLHSTIYINIKRYMQNPYIQDS